MAKEQDGKGATAENAAVDTAGTVARVTGGVVGATVIGLAKGVTKAIVRSVKH